MKCKACGYEGNDFWELDPAQASNPKELIRFDHFICPQCSRSFYEKNWNSYFSKWKDGHDSDTSGTL